MVEIGIDSLAKELHLCKALLEKRSALRGWLVGIAKPPSDTAVRSAVRDGVIRR